MSERIPDDWKEAVIQILEEGDHHNIEITESAIWDFQSMIPGAFICDMHEAFLKGLSSKDIEGNRKYDMFPPGIIFEFIFCYKGRFIYGKIGLSEDRTKVSIISAHRPKRGNSL